MNASRAPGEWQTYDIVFMAPRFGGDGSLERAATMTVLHNGVLVQNHAKLEGPTVVRGSPRYEPHAPKAPVQLQNHRNFVSYRNIRVREF